VARSINGARRSAPDAALAHRQDGRHQNQVHRSLSDDQNRTIVRWVDQGAARATQGHAGGHRVERTEWTLAGTSPDGTGLIIRSPVDAEGSAIGSWWKPSARRLTEPRWRRG